MNGTMSFANSNSFTFFFLSNLDSFYFFFFPLIVVVRSSKTLLNKSAKSAHGLVLFNKWHWEY